MQTTRVRGLRVMVILLLVVEALQFEFGMAVNLSPSLPSLPPFSFSLVDVNRALQGVGGAAVIHASIGGLLVLLALANLIWSLVSHVRGAQVFGTLGFISIFLAAYTGLFFVLSGFQNDGLSHGMASNFLLSFIFYFLELYMLRPREMVKGN